MNKCYACLKENTKIFTDQPVDWEYYHKRDNSVSIFQCQSCFSLFQYPMPTPAECEGFYPPDYQNYSSGSIPFLTQLLEKQQKVVAENFIKSYGQDSVVLDYGCGDGMFLHVLNKHGMNNVFGYEPSHRESREYFEGDVYIANSLEELLDKSIKFDVIRLNHVIEHIPDIDEKIGILQKLLKEDGQIIGQTPNPDHLSTRIFKGLWGALHYPYHTIIFTPQGLKEAANRWGLSVYKVESALMPTAWSMSLENFIKKAIRSDKRGRLKVYSLLIAVGLFLSILEKLIPSHIGGVYDFEMREE